MSAADWISGAGLAVSVIGFAIAIWQLVRTANASVATRGAVERTEKRMALNHLLVLLPQFSVVENDLDNAAENDDRALARRSLITYAHFAAEVATILQGQDSISAELVLNLKESATEASRAKAALIDASPGKHTRQLTKEVRELISGMSVQIRTLATAFQISAG